MNKADFAAKPIRILQLTDFHLLADPSTTMMGIDTDQSFLAALEHARRGENDVDLFLLTGDLVQDAHPDAYQRLRGFLSVVAKPCFCLPGNHDDPEMIRSVLVGGQLAYTRQILRDDWQIICLDSIIPGHPGGYLAAHQLDLLESLLSEQAHRHALISLHHSPVPTGSAWLDTMMLSNHQAFFALLKRFPQVKAVVFGHIHQALDVAYAGIRCLGAPSTCFQFKPGSEDFGLDFLPGGYRRLALYPDGEILTEVIRLDSVPPGLDMASGGY
jgi:Icc protein